MSDDMRTALVSIASLIIIVIAAGFGLELIRKEKLVQDGAVLAAATGIVICGMYFLHR